MFLLRFTITGLCCLGLVFSNAWADSIKTYPVEPFDFIYPETKFTGQPIRSISLEMARNEYEPVTFAVISEKDFPEVTVTIDEPVSSRGNKISRSNIDLGVVKVWKQAGTNYWPDKEIIVPELILKDDTITINDAWKDGIYIPPSFPSTFRTKFSKGEAKQVWITVKTDAKANPPGIYKGTLKFLAQGSVIGTLNLSIDVQPIILPEPDKKYFIYFRGRINPNHFEYVDKERYMKQLHDIREHGFTGVTIYESDYNSAVEAIDRAKAAGMQTIIITGFNPITQDIVRKLKDYCAQKKIEIWFYGYDEPSTDENLTAHIIKSRIIHEGGGKVVTAISKAPADLLKDKNYASFPDKTFEPLDWPNYHLGESATYIEGLVNGRAKRQDPFETYYWQIYLENPSMNRLYAGYYLWRSLMDRVFPYCYQYFYPISPYNGGDIYDVKGYKGRDRKFRVLNVTYPSKEGPVPTLQWEAFREGVDDVRYLGRLKELTAGKVMPEISKKVDEILRDFPYVGDDNKGKQIVSVSKFSSARKKLIDIILQLQATK